MKKTFDADDVEIACEEWGCNCGPAALAFALQTTLDSVRPALPDFEKRRYTNPTMMRQALAYFGRGFSVVREPCISDLFDVRPALVRIQFTGPWCDPKPQKWASKYTHWIVAWFDLTGNKVFDINCGMSFVDDWEKTIVPVITDSIKNADGDWYPANVWRLQPEELPPRKSLTNIPLSREMDLRIRQMEAGIEPEAP
jgi:hypothetical protein